MIRISTYVIVLIIFLSSAFNNVYSQTRRITFNLVTGTNGVSIGKVNAITRDKRGFMWFSDQTNRCIIRFDGSHMSKFVHQPGNSNSLGGAYPECIAADSAGNIWIGFYGMGLDRFNPETNTFTHYRYQKNGNNGLVSDTVSAVLVDHLGNVWIGTNEGLDMLDTETGIFKKYQNIPGDSTSLSHDVVRAIYEDRSRTIWVGTGFTWHANQKGGLNCFNRSTGTFSHYSHDYKNPNTLKDNKVRAILEDSYGNLWIGTRQNGVHTLDRKTGMVTRYPTLPATTNGLGLPSPAAYDDNITFIVEDADRAIWIGTMLSGVIRYDPKTKQMSRFGIGDGDADLLRDSTSWWAHATADGNVWLSTQNANLFRADIHNVIVPSFPVNVDEGVIAIAEDSPSAVWYGTINGLYLKNNINSTTTVFRNDPDNPGSLSSNLVTALLKDRSGNLWIGTGNALNFYDSKQGTFKRYYHNSPTTSGVIPAIVSLYEDSDSKIWIGTMSAGLFMFDPKTTRFTSFLHKSTDENTVSSNSITCLFASGEQTLWIGTTNWGLNKLDRRNGKFTSYLHGMTVWCMNKDHDGILWVGTTDGLYRYDSTTNRFSPLADENAALSIAEVESIIEDQDRNLWVATENGIYMINRTRDRIIRYGQANGLHDTNNAFSTRAAIMRSDGELQFGYFAGYYGFYPNKLHPPRSNNQVYFTGFWLDNHVMRPGDGGPINNQLDSVKEINLRHNQNNFSISATKIDFRNSGDKRIFYKLENYDNSWRYTNPEEQIQYFKVPAGKYTFRIKTPNSSDGVWQEKSIMVVISPPWWRTWWAYCIYSLLFIVAIWRIHRYQKHRVVAAERKKAQEKQLAQAREIERAYHELKTTQQQLIQSEKMASLGELTAGIAHEIQNPLNFVNNFSEVNKELIDEMKDQLATGNGQQAIEISKNIRDNEEKINYHGKKADAIVKSMLQHSRVSTGQKELTDINALTDEYLRLAYHGFRAKDKSFNAELKTSFDPAVGKINVVPQEIGRVVLNLVNNAFHAVHQKKKKLGDSRLPDGQAYDPFVTVSSLKKDGKVEIHVSDNGDGIPEKIRDKIFQPFFTTKPAGEGTGLGLSLAYDIVKNGHGGDLTVDTREGIGSEFLVVFKNI